MLGYIGLAVAIIIPILVIYWVTRGEPAYRDD